jgi:hypothetical protein
MSICMKITQKTLTYVSSSRTADGQDEAIVDELGGGLEDPLKGCTFSMDPFQAEKDQEVNPVQTLIEILRDNGLSLEFIHQTYCVVE